MRAKAKANSQICTSIVDSLEKHEQQELQTNVRQLENLYGVVQTRLLPKSISANVVSLLHLQTVKISGWDE